MINCDNLKNKIEEFKLDGSASALRAVLDLAYLDFNSKAMLAIKADPIIIAKEFRQNRYFDSIALVCALFAYGRVDMIIRFLNSFNFDLLDPSKPLTLSTDCPYYRFQTKDDVLDFIIALRNLNAKDTNPIKSIIEAEYTKTSTTNGLLEGIRCARMAIFDNLPRKTTDGLNFLIGKIDSKNSPLKRWNMFCRWMVRSDEIDFGVYKKINKKDLILPLDTHTFALCQKLGLITSKSYNLKSALQASEKLQEFCELDPIKYDFALYRIGQLKLF